MHGGARKLDFALCVTPTSVSLPPSVTSASVCKHFVVSSLSSAHFFLSLCLGWQIPNLMFQQRGWCASSESSFKSFPSRAVIKVQRANAFLKVGRQSGTAEQAIGYVCS